MNLTIVISATHGDFDQKSKIGRELDSWWKQKSRSILTMQFQKEHGLECYADYTIAICNSVLFRLPAPILALYSMCRTWLDLRLDHWGHIKPELHWEQNSRLSPWYSPLTCSSISQQHHTVQLYRIQSTPSPFYMTEAAVVIRTRTQFRKLAFSSLRSMHL